MYVVGVDSFYLSTLPPGGGRHIVFRTMYLLRNIKPGERRGVDKIQFLILNLKFINCKLFFIRQLIS